MSIVIKALINYDDMAYPISLLVKVTMMIWHVHCDYVIKCDDVACRSSTFCLFVWLSMMIW
jgi:hypothetical protein